MFYWLYILRAALVLMLSWDTGTISKDKKILSLKLKSRKSGNIFIVINIIRVKKMGVSSFGPPCNNLLSPYLARMATRCRMAYILSLWFFFFFIILLFLFPPPFSSRAYFFSTPNLGGHWTDLNQTWTHVHLWLLFEKFGPNSLGHLLPPMGWDRLWTSTEHISPTEHDNNNRKKIINLQGLPYMPSNLVNFGPETAENGRRVFAHPYIFAFGEQNAGRAHAGLCPAF